MSKHFANLLSFRRRGGEKQSFKAQSQAQREIKTNVWNGKKDSLAARTALYSATSRALHHAGHDRPEGFHDETQASCKHPQSRTFRFDVWFWLSD